MGCSAFCAHIPEFTSPVKTKLKTILGIDGIRIDIAQKLLAT